MQEVVHFDAADRKAITVWDRVRTKRIERPRYDVTSNECKTFGLYWTIETNPTYGPQLRLARDQASKQILPTPDEGERRMAQELADERREETMRESSNITQCVFVTLTNGGFSLAVGA